MAYRRTILIGCGGSGKSTLARKLGEATGYPVIHLDQLYWKPGWVHLEKAEFDQVLANALSGGTWIMDGNFDRTIETRLARCDTVIFLDLPMIVCLLSVVKRVLLSYGRTRPDMGEGCPERFNWAFMKWVWSFNKEKRSKYLSILENCGKNVFIIHSRRELPDLIQKFAAASKEETSC